MRTKEEGIDKASRYAEYRARNKDKISEREKQYRIYNKERISERDKIYRNSLIVKDREKLRNTKRTETRRSEKEKYLKENINKLIESQNEKLSINKEKNRVRSRNYYKINANKVNTKNIKWRENNKKKYDEYQKEYQRKYHKENILKYKSLKRKYLTIAVLNLKESYVTTRITNQYGFKAKEIREFIPEIIQDKREQIISHRIYKQLKNQES